MRKNMRTLLIGDMKRIDDLYRWLELSFEFFDVVLIISENELTSQHYECPVESLAAIEVVKKENADIIFICSSYYQKLEELLLMLGIEKSRLISDQHICRYLAKRDIMRYKAEEIHKKYEMAYDMNDFHVGAFTYGYPQINNYLSKSKLLIGKFCSIAGSVEFMLGGEHRTEWCSTYPFNIMLEEFEHVKGYPYSKGDIVIGNDVWLSEGSRIMSGVHIGDGCVIAAGAVVTKDVEPYSIMGGVPARLIRKRFDEKTVSKLEEIQWWDWPEEYIYDAIPILQSNQIEKLFEYYDTVVRGHNRLPGGAYGEW